MTPLPTWDPLQTKTPLPLRRTFYPLGFALDIETNHDAVLEAARTSWPGETQTQQQPALNFRILVTNDERVERPKTPRYRVQQNLLTVTADENNTAAAQIDEGQAVAWITTSTANHPAHLRFHYLEGIVYVLLSYKYVTPVHAGCIASPATNKGVLLNGPPGTGKSCLVYACARAGLCFVSDDVGYLLRGDRGSRMLGRPRFLRLRPAGLELFPELASYPTTIDDGGESIVEIEIDRVQGISVASECSNAQVVFLERRPEASATLTRVNENEALQLLVKELNVMREDIDREHAATLQRLVERGSYRLVYSDLDAAVTAIRELLE